MPQDKIDFGNSQSSGLEELSGAQRLAVNVVSQGGTIRRRPGLALLPNGSEEYADEDLPISALHSTGGGVIYGVRGDSPTRQIFRSSAAGQMLSLSDVAQGDLPGRTRPIIAETEAALFFAGGRDLQKYVFGDPAASRVGGSPPHATHVLAHDSRVIVNDVDVVTKFAYSSVAQGSSFSGHEVWNGAEDVGGISGDVYPQARPDAVVALAETLGEVVAFGQTTLQTYAPDSEDVLAPVTSLEVGCSAPYSVVRTDSNFAWLDNLRRIVLSDGKSITSLSDPIQDVLNSMETVDDCYGFRVFDGWLDCVVWVFPTDGRAFCFQRGSGWSLWGEGQNGATALSVAAHALNGDVNWVGTTGGLLATLSKSSSTDLGQPIHAEAVTGFLDRGASRRKKCSAVRLTLRRGAATTGEPHGYLYWRDNLGGWNAPLRVSLGKSGDQQTVVSFRSLGVYRRRQWRFVFSGTEELALVSAVEEYDILED